MTKQDQLLTWCKSIRLFSYIDVNDWKRDNFYLRADRTIRQFVEEGKLKRIPDEEAVLRGLRKDGCANLAWFETI